ncbi:hypothetical protein E3P88_00811 [Wallemia ichthyophaga]|nr:Endoglucanase-7 [Wallemia ichthyophaga EXF-994]TIB04049.1 hypothetical protein E3P96_01721 [Wallemia ichthyophaga]EOR04760.1 Endoglucanase-7 [Wallemia ichthyophaga EXF-994]TIB26714.1 hypothetical protein E3P88_00811 [Wallemia ichthyophaga]TIB30924.1 hypothetical protein E3P86_03424 [Wallemia ichthyophaga]TIB36730.1 hypothetical protein E3P84_00834 [Wallemia ichthyophaga]
MLRTAALLTLASYVLGHGYISEFYIGDQRHDGSQASQAGPAIRGVPSDLGYVKYWNLNNANVVCNENGNQPAQQTVDAYAGDVVKMRWHGDRGPTGDYWGHYEGPIMSYMVPCNGDCTQFTPDENTMMFKLDEAGLDTSKPRSPQGFWPTRPSGQGQWAQDRMSTEQQSWWQTTIPSDLAEGQYLLRNEIINLASAKSANPGGHTWPGGIQSYPQCIQLNVKGGQGVTPPMTKATEVFTEDDKFLNIYTPGPDGIASYDIPGPAPYVPGSNNQKRMRRHSRRNAH